MNGNQASGMAMSGMSGMGMSGMPAMPGMPSMPGMGMPGMPAMPGMSANQGQQPSKNLYGKILDELKIPFVVSILFFQKNLIKEKSCILLHCFYNIHNPIVVEVKLFLI